MRLDYTLNRRTDPWPPIDPQGWVTERRYTERSLGESLQRFLSSRQQSWRWLRRLENPDWDIVYEAPWGPIRAGDVFAAWVAHDLLHMRQIIEVHWAFLNQNVTPYSTRYAGEW
ncbi:MAG: DinB family protein [Caldilineaceae bacterium]